MADDVRKIWVLLVSLVDASMRIEALDFSPFIKMEELVLGKLRGSVFFLSVRTLSLYLDIAICKMALQCLLVLDAPGSLFSGDMQKTSY